MKMLMMMVWWRWRRWRLCVEKRKAGTETVCKSYTHVLDKMRLYKWILHQCNGTHTHTVFMWIPHAHMEQHSHVQSHTQTHKHFLPHFFCHHMHVCVCVCESIVHAYYKFGSAFTQQNFYCFVLERRRSRRCLIVVLTSLVRFHLN